MSKRQDTDEFSKIQIVCALFSASIGEDLYFASQIKESIDASLAPEDRDNPERFFNAAQELASSWKDSGQTLGFKLVPASRQNSPFSLLSLREQLLGSIKATCRFQRAVVVLSGLKEAICPAGKRWSKRRREEYHEAISFARDFYRQRSRPSSRTELIIM